jgi:hypothetical protein
MGLAGLVWAMLAAQDGTALAERYASGVRALVEAKCGKCHSPSKKKGGLDLVSLKDPKAALRERKAWRLGAEAVAAGEMPPEGEPALAAADRKALLDWMRAAADFLDCSDPAERDPGPPLLRRLTRTEYDLTVRDLLGIAFDAGERAGLPADGGGQAFENQAAGLVLPPALMEKYFAAADLALERFLADLGRKSAGTAFAWKAASTKAALGDLVRRAWRRPPSAAELARYEALLARGQGPEALRLPLRALLVSPNFLFRIEEDRPAPKGRPGAPLSGHEVAVRLSYFLTSSMPDAELFKAAEEGRLTDAAGVEAQARRLLASPRAKALATGFGMQWLQLQKLEAARPSTEYFPTFNGRLRESMRLEAEHFLDGLRREDRPLTDVIDASYTYLTPELAKHYGIPGVSGKEPVKVELKPEHHRGGVLGMGAVLAVNAHVHRTSPTLRGKWILEVLLGTPPPPPPPDAGQIEEGKGKGKEAKSFRELLTLHATQPACAACHRRIDPLGFALDPFNAVGEWRASQGGQPIDAVGVLPTGERFEGFEGLKQVLLGRKEQILRHLASEMLSYALGRGTLPSDECALREIGARMKAEGNRFSSLVLGIVTSAPFRERRAAGKAE